STASNAKAAKRGPQRPRREPTIAEVRSKGALKSRSIMWKPLRTWRELYVLRVYDIRLGGILAFTLIPLIRSQRQVPISPIAAGFEAISAIKLAPYFSDIVSPTKSTR